MGPTPDTGRGARPAKEYSRGCRESRNPSPTTAAPASALPHFARAPGPNPAELAATAPTSGAGRRKTGRKTAAGRPRAPDCLDSSARHIPDKGISPSHPNPPQTSAPPSLGQNTRLRPPHPRANSQNPFPSSRSICQRGPISREPDSSALGRGLTSIPPQYYKNEILSELNQLFSLYFFNSTRALPLPPRELSPSERGKSPLIPRPTPSPNDTKRRYFGDLSVVCSLALRVQIEQCLGKRPRTGGRPGRQSNRGDRQEHDEMA